MKLTFLGAAHEVTGSCTLLEAAGLRILIDCGMEQGPDTYENCALPVAASQIDLVLLTHAHIDHSGRLPLLSKNGFRGAVYATAATTRLCSIMLRDSAHIQEFEAQWRNRKASRSGGAPYEPLYTVEDAERALQRFVPCRYGQSYHAADGIAVRFIDAGHLLGSSSIFVTVTEGGQSKTLLFSGDIGNTDRPLIRDPQKPDKADYVVIESTYGGRNHPPRKDYLGQMTDILKSTFAKGGNVVIPCFAVGRTQEMLYLLHRIRTEGLLPAFPDFPVWVDSPLAVEATHIYSDDMREYYDEETLRLLKEQDAVLSFPGLHMSVTADDSRAINADKRPKVILSASGMCEAGRIRHHLKHNLWRPECTVLFVGYQSEGTVGRALLNGAPTVKLFGEEIKVRANIQNIDGISGHADQTMLLDWLASLEAPPAQVFVNHGDDEACEQLAALIGEQLHYPATAPYNGAEYDLSAGLCLQRGNDKKLAKKQRGDSVFDKLVAAGKRLTALIATLRGRPNKELSSLTAQINELCNKWEK